MTRRLPASSAELWLAFRVALRHPVLLVAWLRGADREDLQRIIVKRTLFPRMYDLLAEIRTMWSSVPQHALPLDWLSVEQLAAKDARTGRSASYYYTLYALVRGLKPSCVVETGVWWGLSSLFILQALEDNKHGMLVSIDKPNEPFSYGSGLRHTDNIPSERDTGSIVPARLRGRWRLHLGDSKELLPRLLGELGPIDIFIHDSGHSYELMTFEYSTAWANLRNGGVLVSDDIDLNRAFDDFGHRASELRRFTTYGTSMFGVMMRSDGRETPLFNNTTSSESLAA